LATAWKNGALLNATLARLRPGDELFFANETYHLVGGIKVANLKNNIIHFDGTLKFTANTGSWPRDGNGRVLECFQFDNIDNVKFTSKSVGVLDGSGEAWWGAIGYAEFQENRPRLLNIGNSKNILIENILFKSSPYWTVWIYNVDGLEIRYSEVSNRRDSYDGHDYYNLQFVLL
jgi:polygalacturonase